ncbi:MAG: hypothetical protein MJB57_09215 [Gemmatimonadetes bacterium]|nr:hypothetical protein [Gemmatimonadota bacterium]
MFIIVNNVQSRLRHFRERVEGLTLREFRARVNSELPEDQRLSLGTLSNYERPSNGTHRPGPRAEFMAALKRAFPELRLEWLILGDGQPTHMAERLASPDGLEAHAESNDTDREGARFATLVLERYPDLELLSPEASALFMAALTRLAMGEPDMAFDEPQLLELAADLRWFLLAPVGTWGFDHDPPYRVFSDYAVSMLSALMLLMPEPGAGDPVSAYPTSAGPRLRRFHPAGFS